MAAPYAQPGYPGGPQQGYPGGPQPGYPGGPQPGYAPPAQGYAPASAAPAAGYPPKAAGMKYKFENYHKILELIMFPCPYSRAIKSQLRP